jgi:hypothetical protein
LFRKHPLLLQKHAPLIKKHVLLSKTYKFPFPDLPGWAQRGVLFG